MIIAKVCFIQIGDIALAGTDEPIQLKTFEPSGQGRTIIFRGYYLAIYRKDHIAVLVDNSERGPTLESKPYMVPAGYSVQVRGAIVHFEN